MHGASSQNISLIGAKISLEQAPKVFSSTDIRMDKNVIKSIYVILNNQNARKNYLK